MQAKHIKGTLSLCAALLAGVALVAASGAGAAKAPKTARIDVSTKAAVVHYLRSIHVNPKGIVIQRGSHNYAGASCPGKGWTCTHSRRVVQIATGHGKNRFRCASGRCVVIQLTKSPLAASTAKCVKTTGTSQFCSITQSGTGPNTAIVYMNVTTLNGQTQSVTQNAEITQTANTALNKACVFQRTNINGPATARRGIPLTVSLDAHQSISIDQNSHSGGNTVQNASSASGGSCATGPLNQAQSITSKANGAGSITQKENAANGDANLILNIKQNQGDGFIGSAHGANNATFNQTNTLTAVVAAAGPVNQTQSSVNGGLLATVNQDSRDVSTAIATQTETQCEDAHLQGEPLTCDTDDLDPPGYSLTQTQVGPLRKGAGDSMQTGNAGNVFTVNQSSTQDNDTGSNQTNLIQGDCTTDGNCTVTQDTDINGTENTNTASGQNVDTQTTCSGDDCTSTGPTTTGNLTLLPDGLSVANTDVDEFGYGGMRGDGSGSIAVSGVSAPVLHAFLYWNGPTDSTDADSNSAVTFAGTPITGANIGTASSNCWENSVPSFSNSQSYRADVTALVTGNDATYSLADFTKPGNIDINGVALVVFYDDGNSGNDRTVVLWNGNDSNVLPFNGTTWPVDGWDETISDVPYPGSGSASLDVVVSDGQTFTDDALLVNGTEIAPTGGIFQGDSTPAGPFSANGDLWDVESFDITSLLSSGPNDVQVTTGEVADCLSLVVAAANVPASTAPVILAPTFAATQHAAATQAQTAPARASRTSGAGATR